MKAFIAYTLVAIGIPVFVGLLFGTIVAIPIAGLFSKSPNLRSAIIPYLEVFSGIGAAIAGILLFRAFSLTPTIAVPLIMAAWISFYFFSRRQPIQAWCSWMIGIIGGWFVTPHLS